MKDRFGIGWDAGAIHVKVEASFKVKVGRAIGRRRSEGVGSHRGSQVGATLPSLFYSPYELRVRARVRILPFVSSLSSSVPASVGDGGQ